MIREEWFNQSDKILGGLYGALIGDEWGEKKFLFDLFPFGPAKQAGRYAGTPKPTGCV